MGINLANLSNDTSEQKLDMLLSAVATLPQGQEKLEKMTSRVVALKAKVASQEATINSMGKEIKRLKEQANDRDQQARDLTVRLFNFPIADGDTAETGRIFSIAS
jgi:CII-binding regulator of phage lambda lysogenization HflD